MSPHLRQRHKRESFEVGHIPGVKGTVLSDFSQWSGLAFIVDGQRVKPRGFGRRVTLPGTPRNVEARLKGALPGAEQLLVGEDAYATGPAVPLGLRVLALLPLVAVLLAKPYLGLPVALVAENFNIAVVRSSRSRRVKLALMALCTGLAVGVALGLSAAFGSPFDF